LPATLLGIWQARRRWRDIDLIHINEITILLPGLFAKALLKRPLVVHARSVQQQRGARTRIMKRLLERHADAVVAIDETVRASLPVAAEVVHNGFTPATADPMGQLSGRLHPGSLRVGMVGTLLGLKGVFEF